MTLLLRTGPNIAIDRRITWDDGQYHHESKILHRDKGMAIVGLGTQRGHKRLAKWIADGADEDKWPFEIGRDLRGGTCAVFRHNRVEMYDVANPFVTTIKYADMPDQLWADGTGDQYAMGLLKGWQLWKSYASALKHGPDQPDWEIIKMVFKKVSERYESVSPECEIIKISELKGEKE